MSYEAGLIKYILKGPFTNPIAFFIYGSGLIAAFNGLVEGIAGNGDIVMATIVYYETKYIPPTTLEDIAAPILIGAFVAGLKWYVNTPRNGNYGGRSRRSRRGGRRYR